MWRSVKSIGLSDMANLSSSKDAVMAQSREGALAAPGRLPHVRKPFAFKKDSTLGPVSIADATSLAVHIAECGSVVP